MEGKRTQTHNFMRRGGLITVFLMVAWILAVGKLIPLSGIVSDKGIAVYAVSYELFLVLSLISSYFIPGFVSKRIALKVSRGQYRNARRVFSVSLLAGLALNTVLALAVYLISELYATGFMQVSYAGFAIKCICLAFPLYGAGSAFKGYFEGMGTMMPTCMAGLIEQMVALPVSFLMAFPMHAYGEKVSDFLMEENFAASYGGGAICLALLIGAAVSLLFLVAVYFIYQGRFRRQILNDTTKNQDTIGELILQFFQAVFPFVCSALFLFADTWMNQRLYFTFALKNKDIGTALTSYGVYYAKYRSLILIFVTILIAACHFLPSVVSKLEAREAYHQMQLEFQSGIRRIAVIGGVMSLVCTLLSKVIAGILYKQNVQLAAKLLLVGGFAILAYALAIYTTAFVRGLDLQWLSAAAWIFCLIVQGLIAYLILNHTGLDIVSLAVMNIVYPLLISGVNTLIVYKRINR